MMARPPLISLLPSQLSSFCSPYSLALPGRTALVRILVLMAQDSGAPLQRSGMVVFSSSIQGSGLTWE